MQTDKPNVLLLLSQLKCSRIVWKHVLHKTVASVYCNTDDLTANNTVGKETSTF